MRRADLRKHERRDHCRNDPKFHLGEAEDGVLGGDRDVADGGQSGASAERRALNARDDRPRTVVDRAEHVAHSFRVDGVGLEAQIERLAHPVDVGAAAEDAPLTREDDGPHVVGRSNAREGGVQFGDDVGVERVANGGTRQRDACDAVGEGEVDGLLSHGPCRFSPRRRMSS